MFDTYMEGVSMKIICDTTFLDGADRFETGDTRTVADTRGVYFIANGWAHEAGGEPVAVASAEVTLNVQNATIGQEVSNG